RDKMDGGTINSTSDGVDSLDVVTAPPEPQIQPSPPRKPEAAADNDSSSPQHKSEEPPDMLDFLTTPDMTELPQILQRSQPNQTQNPQQTRRDTPLARFDFVNMNRQKSMVVMTNKESIFPVTMVTVLFFLWGLAYGFLDTLNIQFQLIARM